MQGKHIVGPGKDYHRTTVTNSLHCIHPRSSSMHTFTRLPFWVPNPSTYKNSRRCAQRVGNFWITTGEVID